METIRVGTEEVLVRAGGRETGGALLAVEVTMPPGGGPPALHRHPSAELYRVERGELAIYREDADGAIVRIGAPAGAVVPIPGGAAHTIRNESDADAHASVVFAPGGEMERFMRAAAGATSPADVLALAVAHGVEPVQAAASPSRTA
jgi:oxalate decarboxylase/phosphoglucose isomerase-like protein (cupin superfamily)